MSKRDGYLRKGIVQGYHQGADLPVEVHVADLDAFEAGDSRIVRARVGEGTYVPGLYQALEVDGAFCPITDIDIEEESGELMLHLGAPEVKADSRAVRALGRRGPRLDD
jgi:hypothetical protein